MRIAIENFRGEAPRLKPQGLPEDAAQAAINARLQSGDLEVWKQFAFTQELANSGDVETIYLLNGAWLSWEADVDVARGTVPGDNTFRTYLTGPDVYGQPRFTTYALATTGSPPFPVTTRPLGVPAPDSPPTLVLGVSTVPTESTVEVFDEGDQLTTAWTTSPNFSDTFTRALVEQDAGVGNGAPSYRITQQENNEHPAYLVRDFGVGDSQVVDISFDFMFNASDKPRMLAHLLTDISGNGIAVLWHENGEFQIAISTEFSEHGLSALTGVNVGPPGSGVWYTCQVSVVRNSSGTKTVRAAVYLGSAQIGTTIVATNAFVNSGGNVGFSYMVAEHTSPSDGQVWYDNILVRGTSPTDPATQTPINYVYTFVNDLGEESAPSLPSATVLKDDGTAVTVTTQTAVQSGFSVDYGVATKRIYRAVIGNAGTVFRFIAEIPLSQADYVDELTDEETGDPLETEDWDLPPDDLRGILALPNGIMAGFRRNQLCLSAQNHPHAWPVANRLNTDTDIVAIGNIDNTVVIGTEAFPYTATGNDPSAYSMTKLEKRQACVSKRSIAHITGLGVLFASPDGIVAVAGNGTVRNLTETIYTRRQWQEFEPENIRAIEHDDIYFFFPDGAQGYALDMKETGFGLISLSFHATAMHADPLTDKLFFVLDQLEEPATPYLPLPSTLPDITDSLNENQSLEEFDDIDPVTLAPFTLTSGNMSVFTKASTPDGFGLKVAAAFTLTADAISRSITPRLANEVSVDFVINSVNSDDSGIIGWTQSGTPKIGIIPVRETALDASRRVHALIDAEEINLTSSQVDIGVWYRLHITLSATPGATVGTVTRLSDNVVVGTGTYSSGHAPMTVDGLRVSHDSGGTSCETIFDNAVVGTNLIVGGKNIFEFDAPTSYGDLVQSYKGKLHLLPRPTAFVYCQVKAADFTNLVLNLYADGVLFYNGPVTSSEPFTLPLTDEYDEFEFEFIGTSRVRSAQFVEDIRELN